MDDVTCETSADGHRGIVPDNRHAELRRAYYSVVSFMDSQLGRVLDALEETGLRNSTAIVFWGDHGCVWVGRWVVVERGSEGMRLRVAICLIFRRVQIPIGRTWGLVQDHQFRT